MVKNCHQNSQKQSKTVKKKSKTVKDNQNKGEKINNQQSSDTKYLNMILCDLHQHYLDRDTTRAFWIIQVRHNQTP